MEAAVQQAKDQAELNELVVWAAARGLLADAEELVARGAELSTADKHGRRPVHYAAAHGHVGMLQYLSRKGADLEAEDPAARLPLHHAAAGAKSVEALRYLIQHTTWLNAQDAADDTALHLAARKGWVDGVRLLLAAGAEVDVANKRGLSALGEAVAGGHADAAEALLGAAADPNWRAAGYTLLHVAAGLGQTGTLQLLLQHLGKSSRLMNDSSNDDSATPLHAAAMAGSLAAAKLLLWYDADAGIPGADGTCAWELVPAGEAISSTAKLPVSKQQQQQQQQAATAQRQEELQELQTLLRDAASKAKGGKSAAAATRGSKAGVTSQQAPAAGAAAARSPVDEYSEQMRQLSPAEQTRKVEVLARLPVVQLKEAAYLSDDAKAAIAQVRRANQLLGVYHAVAALRADEEFQEDAADPEVQAALTDMGLHNNMDKYAARRQVVSVATKLKKFHTVMQECGGVKLGLQDLLIPPGQTLASLTAKDSAQIEKLTAAAAAARAHAVTAITGQPLPEAFINRRSVGRPQGVSSSGGGEIEASEDGSGHSKAAGAAGTAPATDLDRELQQHSQASKAAGANSTLQRIRRYLNPPREELEAMPIGRRMRFEVVNSFVQAVKIMLMVMGIMALFWCFGMLPSQQVLPDEQLVGQQQQQQPQQQAASVEGHGEL